jgi:hypothetical protein
MHTLKPLVLIVFFCLFLGTLKAQTPPLFRYGKYGCTASKYHNGLSEYQGRGYLTLMKDGSYTYSGFSKPSAGKFTIDKTGNLSFTGGYLDKGRGEKIDRPNKYFLTFPTNPDNRWTCSCIEK